MRIENYSECTEYALVNERKAVVKRCQDEIETRLKNKRTYIEDVKGKRVIVDLDEWIKSPALIRRLINPDYFGYVGFDYEVKWIERWRDNEESESGR